MSKYLLFYSSSGLTHSLSGIAYCCKFIKDNNYKYKLIFLNQQYTDFLKYFEIKDKNIVLINKDEINDNILFLNKYKYKYEILKDKHYKYMTYNKYCIDYEDEKDIDLNFDLYKIKDKYENLVLCGPKSLYLINDYLVVKQNIINELELLNKKYNNYISVHYRNTDMKHDINEIIKNTNNELIKYNDLNNNEKIKYIHLATDDINSIKKFKEEYNNLEFIELYKPKYNNKFHHRNQEYNDIINLLKDIYFCYKSIIFIKSSSSTLSKFILDIRYKKNNIFNFEKK